MTNIQQNPSAANGDAPKNNLPEIIRLSIEDGLAKSMPDLIAQSLKTEINTFETKIGEKVTDLDGRVIVLGEQVTGLDGKVIVLGEQITGLDGKVIAFGEQVADLDGKVIVLGEQVTDLDGRVIVLGEQVTVLDGKVVVLGERVTALEGKVVVLGERVTALEGKVIVLGEQITALDGKVIVLGERVTALEGKVVVLGEQITALDKKVTEIKDGNEKFQERMERNFKDFQTMGIAILGIFLVLPTTIGWMDPAVLSNPKSADAAQVTQIQNQNTQIKEQVARLEAQFAKMFEYFQASSGATLSPPALQPAQDAGGQDAQSVQPVPARPPPQTGDEPEDQPVDFPSD